MEDKEIKLLMLFISVWAWEIIAVIFLTTGAILIFIGSFGVGLGFEGAFVLCSYMSAKRAIQLRNHNAQKG